MNKEEVIKLLEANLHASMEAYEDSTYVPPVREEIEALNEAINMLTKATIWIPCDEQMPTTDDRVINVMLRDGTTTNCVPSASGWFAYSVRGGIITHWSHIKPITSN